jgi:lactate dehydrogenase-like 2-hydroxyacid dehydrogenase
MKVVAYSIRPFEKEFLAKANQKKHEITLISNTLSLETAIYAAGKEAVIVSGSDEVSARVIDVLAGLGIKCITSRSVDINHIDKAYALSHHIKLSNVPGYLTSSLQQNADQVIKNLDLWQENKCLGNACISIKKCTL